MKRPAFLFARMDAHNRQRVKVYEAMIAEWEASLTDASEPRAEQLRLDIADLRSWINTMGWCGSPMKSNRPNRPHKRETVRGTMRKTGLRLAGFKRRTPRTERAK